MQNQQQAPEQQQKPVAAQRTPDHLPMVSPDDAANLSNFFIDKYLVSCRCVTPEEVVRCLGMLSDMIEDVNNRMIEIIQPVSDDHGHDHGVIEHEAAPTTTEAVRKPVEQPSAPRNSSRRNKPRRHR